MKRICEMPPLLNGNEAQQLQQLRDYLVRLVMQLNEEENND